MPEKVNDPVDYHVLHYTPIASIRNEEVDAECRKEVPSSFMVEVVETITSPYIALGLLIGLAMLMMWWRLDPPEPAVVVL